MHLRTFPSVAAHINASDAHPGALERRSPNAVIPLEAVISMVDGQRAFRFRKLTSHILVISARSNLGPALA